MKRDVTVAIPAIPPRVTGLLMEAVGSAMNQTVAASGGISCVLDVAKQGAAVTRQRALDAVRTNWVAFLDDDDKWYPNHLETHLRILEESGADYSYSWFDGNNPFPMHRGRQMNPDEPHHTTMTVVVRTELAKEAGFMPHPDANEVWPGEDWQFTLRCLQLGAKFIGTDEVTWHYRMHGHHTSGLTSRW